MALIDDYQLTQDTVLKQRMVMAIAQAATEIIGETDQGTGTKRAKREALALQFLSAPHQLVERFMLVVIAVNHPTNANVTDAQIVAAVKAAWSDMAGVNSSDT